jgi:hypothetical protein
MEGNLEDTIIEIAESEQRENRLERNQSTGNLWNYNKRSRLVSLGFQWERRKKVGLNQ